MSPEELKRLRDLATRLTQTVSVVTDVDGPRPVTYLSPATTETLKAASGGMLALLDEVERLRAVPPLVIQEMGDLTKGVAAVISGDQVVYMRNLHSEDVVEARRAERERCAKVAISVQVEQVERAGHTASGRIAERIRALPEEP